MSQKRNLLFFSLSLIVLLLFSEQSSRAQIRTGWNHYFTDRGIPIYLHGEGNGFILQNPVMKYCFHKSLTFDLQ